MPDEYANLMQSTSQPPYAVIVVVVAILAVAGVASVAIFHYDDAADALASHRHGHGCDLVRFVAAFLGVRSGSLAQQKANEGAAIQALAASRGRSPCLAGGSDASAQRRRRRAHLTGPRPRRECGHLPGATRPDSSSPVARKDQISCRLHRQRCSRNQLERR